MGKFKQPRVIWQAVDFEPFPRRWVLETEYEKVLAAFTEAQEEIKRLREALEMIAHNYPGDPVIGVTHQDTAKQALAETEGNQSDGTQQNNQKCEG